MYLIGIVAGLTCIAIWSYLLLLHGSFWKIWRLQAPPQSLTEVDGKIAVVLPARDEADVIGATVRSLLKQNLLKSIHIFVVDDHSSDGTAQAARQAAQSCGRIGQLAVLKSSNLPAGWTGKLWAVQQGIQEATKLSPEFLLLTDADILHGPSSVATLVATARAGNYDLASFMVKLHCRSFAERLLIPPFVFFFFLLYPPSWIRNPKHRTAGAAGGCMLVRPEALERAGGIASIRSEIIDDCALARVVKRSGGLVWLGLTPDTRSDRAYGSFAEIEHTIVRTAFNQLGHSVLLLIAAILGLIFTYLVPLLLVFSGSKPLAALGLIGWLLMALAYLPMVRFYELSPLWSLTLPLSACFYMAATIHSACKYWAGRGGEWKGRAQDTASADIKTPSSRQA
jgi:hopene-associated glycosyltransferase HpnB